MEGRPEPCGVGIATCNKKQQEVLRGQWRVKRTRPVGGRKSLAWCVQNEVMKLGPDDRGPCARLKSLTWTWSMEKLTEEQNSGRTAGRRVERQRDQLERGWRIQAGGDPTTEAVEAKGGRWGVITLVSLWTGD